ncbi:MAG: quinone-dependent dihydroorotate dehydrogenase [Bacteroidales bacterium]|nr:quinone-dependent dihydroorotate dehydrogenase [Bacteroidales bacterium]
MYKLLIRPLLFLFNPEKAHKIALGALRVARYIPGARFLIRLCCKKRSKSLERELFGIKFPNPVGISAGLDKNGEYYNDLASLGFGFIEIGSLTPLPQSGNPAPRLFRLPKDRALINRMGINNTGVKAALNHLKKDNPRIIVGANITKNTTTPNSEAYKDYVRCVSLLYDFVDFFVLNVSCPNVKDLQQLQVGDMLSQIIDAVLEVRRYSEDSRPILLKVSPDITREQIDEIIHLCLINGIDGIVATNTTHSRDGLKTPEKQVEACGEGGLSGAPLFEKSLEMVKYIHEKSNGLLPIIASGGIMSPQQAAAMLDAGASLVEVYTGFIYEGPRFAKRIIRYLKKKARQ